MPKHHRLTRSDLAISARGPRRRISGDYFFLVVAPLPDARRARAACVVSKKVSARASVRNSLKRRCREVLRPHLSKYTPPRALIFHARREALDASFSRLKRDIEKLLTRAR